MTTKAAKIAATTTALDAAVVAAHAARDLFLTTGTDADLAALRVAQKAQDAASGALAALGR